VKPTGASSSRKRHLDSEDAAGHQPKRVRLTKENLALFNKMGRRKGTEGSNSSSTSSHLESSAESATTKTTTSSGFAIQAQKNGILNQVHSKPPKNLEDRRKGLARSRETASPPESVYERYSNTVLKACNEATMVFEVGGQLLKTHYDTGYPRAFNQAFTAFPRDVGFNNGLSAPQPDFVEGLEIREYQPFPVDEQVSGAVLFRDDPFSVTLPHIAGEWKGRGKDMDEAKMRSAYDRAALTYARNQALSYPGNPDPPGHAEVATFTTDGTNINFFAHYAAVSGDGVLEYHQYPIASTNLTNSFEDFKKGRRQLRNLQDDAKHLSYALRDQLKDHWKARRGPGSSADQDRRGLGDVPEEPELDADDDDGFAAVAPPPMLIPEELGDGEPAAHVVSTTRLPVMVLSTILCLCRRLRGRLEKILGRSPASVAG
jgi:hypothetical protein